MKLKNDSISWSVPLTNMADIAYLLLIFIIIFSLISSQKKYSVLVPTSKSGEDDNSISYKLIISSDFFVLEDTIFEDKVFFKKQLSSLDNNKPVTIIANREISFIHIKKMIELLKQNGFNKIEFLVSG